MHAYVRQSGLYNRVGNQVMIRAHVAMLRVDGSMAGSLQIGGLPLAAAGPPGPPTVVSVSASGISHAPGYSAFHGLIAPGATVIDIVEAGSALRCPNVPAASLGANAELLLSATYAA